MLSLRLKLKIFTALICSAAGFALAGEVRAAIFVDNATTGCVNGSQTYNPSTRTCSGGTHTVYTTLNNANSGISAGTSGSQIVVNIRSGTPYLTTLTITKNYTTWRKWPSDNQKPLIDGEYVRPTNAYTGLFYGNKRAGVVVDGIKFTRAAYILEEYVNMSSHLYNGRNGVALDQSSSCIVRNCEFTYIGDAGIAFNTSGTNNIAENNYMYETNLCARNREWWSGAIQIQGNTNAIVRNNTLDRVLGEAIQFHNGCIGGIIEYNIVIDNQRRALHLQNSRDLTARYNLIYHTMSADRYISGYGNRGIVITCENDNWSYDDGYSRDYYIYGNLVSGGMNAIAVLDHTDINDSLIYNVKIFSNTFIESNDVNNPPELIHIDAGARGTGIEIKNNIFFQTAGTIADVPSGITWGNNLWSKAPDADARSNSDPTYAAGYPTLNIADYFQKQSGWTTLTPDSLTGQEFALRSTAVQAINKGANLGAPYNQLLNLTTSNFKTNTFNLIDQNANGAWDIGAGVYAAGGGGDTQAPAVPSGLMVR